MRRKQLHNWRLKEVKTTASLKQTFQRVRAAHVNSGRRKGEVRAVSTEENGKSKTHKTYRNLEIEYNKKEEKSRQRN